MRNRFLASFLLVTVFAFCLSCGGHRPNTTTSLEGMMVPGVGAKVTAGRSEKPVSVPDAFPKEGGVPMLVHLLDAGSYDPDGEIVMWEWNFGDQEEGEGGWHDYTANRGDAWHRYELPGTIVAHMRVTDNDGNKDVAWVKLTLSADGNANPVPVASVGPLSGTAPLTVSFSAEGSYDPDGEIVNWEWDLGDGVFQDFTQSEGVVELTYTDAGLYTTILRITDDNGAMSTASVELDVQISCQRGDWWMFGREQSHHRQSAFIGPQSASLKWKLQMPGPVFSSPAIAVDGTIYVGSFGGVSAVNPNGTSKWCFSSAGAANSSPAIGVDGTVYVVCGSNLVAVSRCGIEKWRFPANGYSSPALGSDGTIYVGTSQGVSAINPDGTEKWNYITQCAVESSPALDSKGTVYFGCGNGSLYAVAPPGQLMWSYQTGNSIFSSPAVADDGSVYVGSGDTYIYGFTPSGSLKWKYPTNGLILTSPAIGADGTVYAGSYDAGLYAINPDGTLRWRYGAQGLLLASPTIGADGTVYFGGMDRQVYAVTPEGVRKWWYRTGLDIRSSCAIAEDGSLYMGCYDGYLYSFQNGPPSSPTDVSASDGTRYLDCQILWRMSSGPTDFRVYRAESSEGPWLEIASTTGGAVQYLDTTGTELIHYWYRVTAVTGGMESPPSQADEGWRASPPPTPPFPPGDWSINLGNGVLLWFVDVPSGPVQLGSPPSEWGHQVSEEPYQTFSVNEFSIGKYPVTNAQWQQFISSGGYNDESLWNYGWSWRVNNNVSQPACWLNLNYSGPGKEDYPVVGISWYEAIAFANWVNRLSQQQAINKTVRLPFEDEWERAAEGDLQRLFPWGDAGIQNMGDNADWVKCNSSHNIFPDIFSYTSPVYWFPDGVSPFGVYDLSGSKWEWNGSKYTYNLGSPYVRLPYVDIGSPCLRGWGNWNDVALRTSFRAYSNGPSGRFSDSSTRLAAVNE